MAGKKKGLAAPLSALLALAVLSHPAPVRAEPDPCSSRATVSPCFDADPAWLQAGPSPFLTFASPRAVEQGALHFLAGAGIAHRPVMLVAPSPHPEGREVPAVELTSTLSLAARYGLGRRMDVTLALPLVPYQSGTGAEGVTAQHASSLRSTTIRDPRVGFLTTLVGAERNAPLALGSRLEIVLPFGEAAAFAGASGLTVAPAFAAELARGRFSLALDLGLRLRPAVSFGTVREGSEAVVALGAGVTLIQAPVVALTLEAFARAGLAAPPVGAPEDARNLPAEWLLGARFQPRPSSRWSAALGGGSGLPVSELGGDSPEGAVLGVTAPTLRLVAAFRYAFELGPGGS